MKPQNIFMYVTVSNDFSKKRFSAWFKLYLPLFALLGKKQNMNETRSAPFPQSENFILNYKII